MRQAWLQSILFPHQKLNKNHLDFFEGKTVLITGASYGIGFEISKLIASQKTNLILIARTQEKLQELQNYCLQTGALTCSIFVCDFYQLEQVKELSDKLKNQFSKIDIWISNAGKSIMRSFEHSKDRWQDIERSIHVNFLSPVYLIQNCFSLLNHQNTVLVNVSALNVKMPATPHWAAYQSSKTAFDQWCQSNAAEWKQKGIKLKNAYLPLVETRMSEPNPQYAQMPKMSAHQAAIKIIRLISSNKSTYQVWWAFGLIFLFPFKKLWAKSMLKSYQK